MNTATRPSDKERSLSDRLHRFASLRWYEEVIRFLFTFAAKTSEILLAAGLVVSTANFLTDGKVMGSNSGLATAWAWAQALAIDSGLGVTFYYIFMSIKYRDWIKVCCYSLLTLLLAIVAGTVTNVDTLSHAVHISIAEATTQVGLDVKFLTTLRAIAVVGFVLMSRLKEVSFKELYEPASHEVASSPQEQNASEKPEPDETAALLRELIAEAMAPMLSALAQQGKTIVTEEQETLLLSDTQETTPPEKSRHAPLLEMSKEGETNQEEQTSQEYQDGALEDRDAKLEHAYQELQAEGKRISGRTLAARAHIRRSTCNQWLAAHHPEVTSEDGEEEQEPQ